MKINVRGRRIFAVITVAAMCLLLQTPYCRGTAAAYDTNRISISELIDEMDKYDGMSVTVKGEVIGDIMIRGEYAWITVNDGPYSEKNLESGAEFSGVSNIGIGIWIPSGDVYSIKSVGGYSRKGDTVEVEGVFHRACSEHGGDTDIHANSLKVVREGYVIPHPFSYFKLLIAALLAGISGLLIYVLVKRKKKYTEE
ncbi:MAG: DNA-binding protein [Actinobacteria bacterium]|nr:DNA-binding protein [Actinomycetota bacterium]